MKLGSTFLTFCVWLVFILLILSFILALVKTIYGVYYPHKMEKTGSPALLCSSSQAQPSLELPLVLVERLL